MNTIELQGILGGALQEKFNKSFERIIDNLQDVNTSSRDKRKITISLEFTQNELRDDVAVKINVVEKLAPQTPMKTAFSIGKDLRTGELYATEYGKQIPGQMSMGDLKMDDGKGETQAADVKTDNSSVVDFRKTRQA